MRQIKKTSNLSYKHNVARRAKGALFKKGFYPNYDINNSVNSASCSRNVDLPINQCPESFVRLEQSVADDVLNAAGQRLNSSVLPFKLRPRRAQSKPESVKDSELACEGSNENFIVNSQKLGCILQLVAKHSCIQPNIKTVVSDRRGVCVEVTIKCTNCNFTTGAQSLSQTIEQRHGKPSGTLNSSLLLPVMSSKMGIADVQLVLACLNIQAPDKRGMQRKLNIMSDQVEDICQDQMLKNQEYVKTITHLSGASAETDVEFDASYTSRPQANNITATQVFAPVIEKSTLKHLPIDINVGNKLCMRKECDHNNKHCKKNYSDHTSINQAESAFLKKSLEKIKKQNIIKVRSVTTDASLSLAKAIREHNVKTSTKVQHYKCFVHAMRNMHKQLRAAKIKVPRGMDLAAYRAKLATSIRIRVRLELTRMQKLFHQQDQYIQRARDAIENILDCFSGKHNGCRRKSVVCQARLKQQKQRIYLPYGRNLQLSSCDMKTLSNIINKYCGVQQLRDTAKLATTNMCESMHSRMFSYAPKSTVWSRNFSGLCHSATIGASIGRGLSLLKLAEKLGVKVRTDDPLFKYAMYMQQTARYHTLRKKETFYKTAKYRSKQRRSSRMLLQSSLYSSQSASVEDHMYAINLNK
jgi:hypothetical protein